MGVILEQEYEYLRREDMTEMIDKKIELAKLHVELKKLELEFIKEHNKQITNIFFKGGASSTWVLPYAQNNLYNAQSALLQNCLGRIW